MTTNQPAIHLVRHPLTVRRLTVRRVEPLAPRMARITLGGSDLDGFVSLAADDHVKLFFPPAAEEQLALPAVGPRGLVYAEDEPRPDHRDYTPRRYRPAERELDIDVYMHGDGPGSRWAARAEYGMVVGVAGPRGSFVVPDGFAWYLLAGDETALPAIGRTLAELPPGTRVRVLIEVGVASDEISLPTEADAEVTWLHRDGADLAAGDLLSRSVRSLALPAGDGYLWAAGEAAAMQAVREHVRARRPHGDGYAKIRGYWKHGIADHQEPHED